MARRLLIACWLSVSLPGVAQLASVESIPVDHREPITIRVLDGKTGQPIPNLRVVLLAGYAENDIDNRSSREETVTNQEGEARLPRTLVNFPFLAALPVRAKLCQAIPHGELYRIGRVRSDGWSAPNHCGVVRTENEPGVLTLFVKQRTEPATKARSESAIADGATLDFPRITSADPRPTPPPNEIQSLLEHESLPTSPSASAPEPRGTATAADSYNVLCTPDR